MGIDRKRRKFMTTAAAGVVGLSGSAAAQNQSGNATGNQTDAGGGGEPETHEVLMVTEGSNFYFDPVGLHVQPGDTVRWVIENGTHTSTAYDDRIPEGAEPWDSGNLAEEGASFEYTFEQEGTYDYYCTPHQQLGMVGRIVCGEPGGPATEGEIPNAPGSGQMPTSQQIVDQGSIAYPFTGTGGGDGDGGGDGGGGAEELHEIGVPYHAHFVGLGAIFGVFASLIFAFYFLKYAESPEHKDQRDRR